MNVNQMHPLRWIPATTSRLLDVGCNVGELLCECRNLYPHIELSGVDINPVAVQEAIRRLPGSAIYASSGHTLPFEDSRFDCVTCIEVLEHMDFHVRTMTAREIARVTRPGGRLVVRCPHTDVFSWFDSNNMRFRFPRLYRTFIGGGCRDSGYAGGSNDIVWHHHFSVKELIDLFAPFFVPSGMRFGGLLIFPIADILRWPFYRKRWTTNILFHLLGHIADYDLGIDFGRASFAVLLALDRVDIESQRS